MNLTEFQTLAIQTAVYPRTRGIDYLTLGLAGEIGEIANHIKKVYRDHAGQVIDAKKSDMAAEVGDAFWYCAALATDVGFNLNDGHTLLPKHLPDLMGCGLKLAKFAGQLAEYAEMEQTSLRDSLIREKVYIVCRYLSAIAYHLGIDVESIQQGTINKLIDRKKRGTLHGDGDKR